MLTNMHCWLEDLLQMKTILQISEPKQCQDKHGLFIRQVFYKA